MLKNLNNRGLTLIEVIAAVVIISIILISFLGLFLQSKKTNVSSETIHDATYEAQKAMERIYILSNTTNSLDELEKPVLNIDGTVYVAGTKDSNTCPSHNNSDLSKLKTTYRFSDTQSTIFTTHISVSLLCDFKDTGKVVIDVYDKNEPTKKRATVENVYIWK